MNKRSKFILTCTVGNIIEWYEFTIYGYLSTVLGKLFFPSKDPFHATILAFSIFGVGFLARPLGGIFLGILGDRLSRRFSLLLSIYLITFSTLVIGILPTYNSIGIWAPVSLTFLRLMQGFSLGGEQSGTIVMMIEQADPHEKGQYGGLAALSLVVGTMMGSIVVCLLEILLTAKQLYLWGWRIPFFLGAIILLFSIKSRFNLWDSKEFLNRSEIKLEKIFSSSYVLRIISGICLNSFLGFGFYTITIFFSNYLKTLAIFNGVVRLIFDISFFCIMFSSIYFTSTFIDKNKKFYFIKYIPIVTLLIVPFIYLALKNKNFLNLYLVFSILTCLIGCYFGNITSFIAELFPVHRRFLGVGIAINFGMMLFGGTAPVTMYYLTEKYSFSFAISLGFVIVSIISIFGFYLFNTFIIGRNFETSNQR